VTPFGCRERVQTATGWLDRQTTSSLILVEQRFFEAPPIQGIHLAGRVASAQSAHGFAKKLDAAARKGTCARPMPALIDALEVFFFSQRQSQPSPADGQMAKTATRVDRRRNR
jgi:hypothetical protein